ncbi:MAG TPA: GWxTD domain-containing protein, partial [Thermoanaerobaculia bacterium]
MRGRALLFLLLLLPLPAAALHPYDRAVPPQEREAVAKLAEKYRTWWEEVDVLLSDVERKTFLALEKDYQRDSFIEKFWQVRDPVRRTAYNGFKERWTANVQQARTLFGDITDGRSRVLLLNGAPDERVESNCSLILWPLEIWFYPPNDKVSEPFAVVLYRRWGAGPFRVWNPGAEGTDALFAFSVLEKVPAPVDVAAGKPKHSLEEISPLSGGGCGDYDHARKILAGISWVASQGIHWDMMEARLAGRQPGPGKEWVSTFNSYSTDVPAGAALLSAKVEVSFPGRWQGRTMVQGLVTVPPGAAGQAALGEARSYNLLLTGEVLHDGHLFD